MYVDIEECLECLKSRVLRLLSEGIKMADSNEKRIRSTERKYRLYIDKTPRKYYIFDHNRIDPCDFQDQSVLADYRNSRWRPKTGSVFIFVQLFFQLI